MVEIRQSLSEQQDSEIAHQNIPSTATDRFCRLARGMVSDYSQVAR